MKVNIFLLLKQLVKNLLIKENSHLLPYVATCFALGSVCGIGFSAGFSQVKALILFYFW